MILLYKLWNIFYIKQYGSKTEILRLAKWTKTYKLSEQSDLIKNETLNNCNKNENNSNSVKWMHSSNEKIKDKIKVKEWNILTRSLL